MTKPVPTYNVFGFMHGEDEHLDLRRPGIPAWRLNDVVLYFTTRGFDGILIERDKDTVYKATSIMPAEDVSLTP